MGGDLRIATPKPIRDLRIPKTDGMHPGPEDFHPLRAGHPAGGCWGRMCGEGVPGMHIPEDQYFRKNLNYFLLRFLTAIVVCGILACISVISPL